MDIFGNKLLVRNHDLQNWCDIIGNLYNCLLAIQFGKRFYWTITTLIGRSDIM